MKVIGFVAGVLMIGLITWSSEVLGPAVQVPLGAEAHPVPMPAGREEGLLRAAGEPAPLPDVPSADPAPGPDVEGQGAGTPAPGQAPEASGDETDASFDQFRPALPSPTESDVIEREAGIAGVATDGAEWLGFFTPFRSEASARGFAQHLEAATGREFRVARAGPGDYRVEFRIVAEEDRDARIAEIELASGLSLRSGRL